MKIFRHRMFRQFSGLLFIPSVFFKADEQKIVTNLNDSDIFARIKKRTQNFLPFRENQFIFTLGPSSVEKTYWV
jgi:hypothetical protein